MKSFVSPQQTSSSSSFYPDVNKIRSEQKFSRIYAIKPTIHATDTIYFTMLRLKEVVSAQNGHQRPCDSLLGSPGSNKLTSWSKCMERLVDYDVYDCTGKKGQDATKKHIWYINTKTASAKTELIIIVSTWPQSEQVELFLTTRHGFQNSDLPKILENLDRK